MERDLAKHGVDFIGALNEAAPIPLIEYEHILDLCKGLRGGLISMRLQVV